MTAVLESAYVSPFVGSAINAFSTLFGWELTPGTPEIQRHFHPGYDISGVIGLSGKIKGTMIVSLEKELALQATELLAQMTPEGIDELVIDTIAEVTNIIGGGAKSGLSQYGLSLSLPTVIVGKNHVISFISSVDTVLVPFTCELGQLSVEVGMTHGTT